MSVSRLMRQPLTVQTVTATTLDAYGSAIPGAQGSPVSVLGYLEQKESVEFLNARETNVTVWHAYLPVGTSIHPMDYITYRGQVFQVDGEPWQVYNPRTASVSHIQCKLQAVS